MRVSFFPYGIVLKVTFVMNFDMIPPHFLLILINAVQFKSGVHVRLIIWAQKRFYLQKILSEFKYLYFTLFFGVTTLNFSIAFVTCFRPVQLFLSSVAAVPCNRHVVLTVFIVCLLSILQKTTLKVQVTSADEVYYALLKSLEVSCK